MIVMKFGGTSVQDAFWMDATLTIAEKSLNKAPLLISSAMTKMTDSIIAAFTAAESGDIQTTQEKIDFIQNHHLNTAKEFLTGKNLEEAVLNMNTMFLQFSSLLKGIGLLRECSARSQDTLLAFGERLSTLLLYYRSLERGIPAELLDSRTMIITDDQFTSASPLIDKTETEIRRQVKYAPGKLIIAQGFIGSTGTGVTTTLGRGGSDYSAALFGAALDAEEVQIWTDVNGIMTTDPRIIKEARTIEKITYEEAGELAYFGAKVVHPATIQPAVRKSIPVYVKNTREPDHPGTAIISKTENAGLRAIACKKGVTVITVDSSRMLNAYGFLKNLFSVFAQYRTSVDLISTSEVSVSITIDDTHALKEIIGELKELGTVTVESEKSIICLVGQALWKDSLFISRVFNQLSDIQIRMISLGSSDINLSIVVPQDKTNRTIEKLHREFFE